MSEQEIEGLATFIEDNMDWFADVEEHTYMIMVDTQALVQVIAKWHKIHENPSP